MPYFRHTYKFILSNRQRYSQYFDVITKRNGKPMVYEFMFYLIIFKVYSIIKMASGLH